MDNESYKKERRTNQRVRVNIKCEIIIRDNSYYGIINNLSKWGLYIKPASNLDQYPAGLSLNDNIRVSFEIPSGDKVILKCNVLWMLTHDDQLNIGVDIIESPSIYLDFVKGIESK